MRNWIALVEQIEPRVAYHGTCVRNWAKADHGDLYVAMNRDIAQKYADEWADEDEEPLVVTVDLTKLDQHRFEPNWETVQQHEDRGEPIPHEWRYTAEHFGTFVISGFTDSDKMLCCYIELTEGVETGWQQTLAQKLDADGLRDIEIVPEQWLVHFSGYAEEISRDGFTMGTPLTHQGWKGAWGNNHKAPGFNFAVAALDEHSVEWWADHVACAVVFRAEGVSCWHKDGFDQVIFWGPSAKRPIYMIETLDDGPWQSTADDGTWAVKMVDGIPVDPHEFNTGDLWSVLNEIRSIRNA